MMDWDEAHLLGDLEAEEARMIDEQLDRSKELEEALEACANALNVVAWGGEFTCFVDAQWDTVDNALVKACATLEKLKGKV